ncbi:hypothetical protein D3C73_1484520 [compost metagenome]
MIVADFGFIAKAHAANGRPAPLVTGAVTNNTDDGFRHAVGGQQPNAKARDKIIFFLHR